MVRIDYQEMLQAGAAQPETPRPGLEPLVDETMSQYTPAMIGGFTGESYNLLVDVSENLTGALITGTPTAKAIIGKARWLLRTVIAQTIGARTHREAEESLPFQVKLPGRKQALRLGLVQLLFGTTSRGKSWRAVLTVIVEPVRPVHIGLTSSSGDVYGAISQVRSRIVDPRYVRLNADNSFLGKNRRNRPVPRGEAYNRYNSLLVLGGQLYGEEVYPLRDHIDGSKRVALIDPVGVFDRHNNMSGPLDFKLKVYYDKHRLSLAEPINTASPAGEVRRLAVEAGALAVMLVPHLLGLGKAANRGFGRFKPSTNSWKGSLRALDDLVSLVEKIAEHMDAKGTYDPANSGVPGVPTGRYRRSLCLRASDAPVLLNMLGAAAMKNAWKTAAGMNIRVSGRTLHTWPLGLPRRGRGQHAWSTGYWLAPPVGGRCDYSNSEEGRRQSSLIAYPESPVSGGRARVNILVFPSGDLADLVEGSTGSGKILCWASNTRVRPVRQLLTVDGVRHIPSGRTERFPKPRSGISRILEVTLDNYEYSLCKHAARSHPC